MKTLVRAFAMVWLICVLALGLSILYGKLFPAPLVEWADHTRWLHDTRTGVNHSLLRRGVTSSTPQISGVQISDSPNAIHRMTLMGNASGLDIQIADAQRRTLHSLHSTDTLNISNVGWLDDNHILVMRVSLSSGDFELTRFAIITGEEEMIGQYDNSYIILSPDRRWLIVSERATGYTEVINIWDARRYEIHAVSTNFSWSSDGHYFASRTEIEGEFVFQLLDTETGYLITEDFAPNRIAWSRNHQDLLIHNTHRLMVYRGTQVITDLTLEKPIRHIEWSPDGRYAYILGEASGDYQLYLLDIEHEIPIRLLVSIPQTVQADGITWAYDSYTLNYVVYDINRAESWVYRIQIPDASTNLLTRIPAQIRQVVYIETLENYEDLP